jgi:hypothetical protein
MLIPDEIMTFYSRKDLVVYKPPPFSIPNVKKAIPSPNVSEVLKDQQALVPNRKQSNIEAHAEKGLGVFPTIVNNVRRWYEN